jgi:hypothetical protein
MMLRSGSWKLRLELAPFSAGKQTLLRMSPIISVFSLFVVRCDLRCLKKSEAISDLAHAGSKYCDEKKGQNLKCRPAKA